MGERCTVEGTVQNIIFQNEENGYTVLCLVTDEGEAITVVGCIPYAAAGESMTVTGVWVNHASYGAQLTAEAVERRMPESEDEIAAYLASGIIKGVGPATASRLVDRFGEDTLRIIEDEPERMSTIKGITAKKAMEIAQAFRALTSLRRVMEFLARYDLPVKETAEEMEYQVYCLMELRARAGRYTPIVLVDCGLQDEAVKRAEQLTTTYHCVTMMKAEELPRYLQ